MKTGRIPFTSGIGRTLLGVLALVVLATFIAPQIAKAETAVGTTISNTVTVTWTGGSDQDTATFDIVLKPTTPDLAFVISNPADLTTGVGEGQDITLSYTLTSQANGVDNYTLGVGSTDFGVTGSAAPIINGNTHTVDLGASMALENVSSSTAVIIPGLAGAHGFGNGDTVVIGTTEYTIDGDPTDNGINTTITLDIAVTIDAGTPIYERIEFNVTLTTGTGTGTHTVESDAYVTGDITIIDTDTRTITVTPASLTVNKTAATDGSPQPGEIITYSITVTNSNSSPAANVVITDPIPDFTYLEGNVLNGGCTDEYSIDGSSFTTAPGDLSTVTDLRFNCNTLAGNDTITISFDVTIE